jgi:hypothetical protein
MKRWTAVLISVLALPFLCTAAVGADEPCDVPHYLLLGDAPLQRLSAAVAKDKQINIAVLGTTSSTLPGADGAASAYPARLEVALKKLLPSLNVRVTSYAQPRQPAGHMAEFVAKLLLDQKPNLVIWQTGTFEALRGSDPEAFRSNVADGVEKLQAAGADVILMNMQYSPRTESMLALGPYVDSMRWVAREREVPLFDRLAIMRHWHDTGAIDLYAATKDFAIAKRAHDCIGRALAAMIIDAAHLQGLGGKTP